MKTNLAVAFGLGLAMITFAPLAQAQTVTPQAATEIERHRGGAARSFDAMDTNRDGFVTLDEWKAAGRREERFNEIDANHTGKITRDDLRAYVMKMREQREQNAASDAQKDNHDGH